MDKEADKGFIAAYRTLSPATLKEKIRLAQEMLKNCSLCPRDCHVDRTSGEYGFCRTGDKPVVSSWDKHFGEEAPLSGRNGSGTIFFTHCNLGCIFCQNWTISHNDEGRTVSCEELASIMLRLQAYGCHNINLVTPTHQVPQILGSLEIALKQGLSIPLVYNCGGYESVRTLQILDGVIDMYMPDFKYADSEVAHEYSGVIDYPDRAKAAIKKMHRQVGDLLLSAQGIAMRGLLVRHLVLPEGLAGTGEVVAFLSKEISPHTYINIMDQYHPCFKADSCPPLNRTITHAEYRTALKEAEDAGLDRLD